MSDMQGRLLVVDDNEMNRDMLSRRLSRRKHIVMTAENGQEALDLIEKESFDVILLDVMMPGISGIEVLKTLRKSYSAADLPIIMATAKSESEDIVEALKLGANDYVTKPLNFPVVLARVSTQLSLKKSQDALKSAHDRMKCDLDAAAQIQQTLLPYNLPEMDSIAIAWKFCPCDELAGDFLNIFQLTENEVGIYIVDVMGHGVPAALLSFSVSRNLSPLAGPDSIVFNSGDKPGPVSPVEVLTKLNTLYPFQMNEDRFFTMLYGVLDMRDGQFRYASAGHHGPLIVSSDQSAQEISGKGFPIGIVDEPDYEETKITLNPGDRMYLYSDGFIEERNQAGEMFDIEKFQESVKSNYSLTLDKSIENTLNAIVSWHGSEHLSDDLSVIGIEMKR
jgi:sigma-B regulation protein RsbU (phosphoserine phosphatase)